MKDLWLICFAIGAGFTASGIVASIFRLVVANPDAPSAKAARIAIMVIAGPSMLFESAMKGFMDKRWPPVFFWLAAAGVAYWSLALGLFLLDVCLHV